MESVIIEIRAGVGGEEAALFARDLFRMYSKYAQKQGWGMRVLDLKESDLGGIKEVTFELKGENAYQKMKWEGGVHRVQRIPQTEKSGRIHTSTATVAVLRKPKIEDNITINPDEVEIDYYKASGPGGQYVNKRMTAVRIKHLPTGIVVTCQTERSLHQNKEAALEILKAKLLEKKEMENLEKLTKERREQIGWAMRAEKIRTYNFPQDRVTDHRIKKSFFDIEEIMDGNLEPVLSALEKNLKN
jgi:peptide chain release factor 1